MDANVQCYKVDSYPRGYMLIINNDKFEGDKLAKRDGSKNDTKDLEQLFTEFGFFCDVKNNLNIEEIEEAMLNFSKMEEHRSMSSCIVALMSHGYEDAEATQYIYGTGGKWISISELVQKFNDKECPNLKDKPKLFIIQACRVTNDPAIEKDGPDTTLTDEPMRIVPVNTTDQTFSFDCKPESMVNQDGDPKTSRADMLLAYPTAHGNPAWRGKQGSLFIQNIIEIFKEKARSKSVTDMLIEVNRQLREKVDPGGNNKDMTGAPEVALTKKWYLRPIT